MGLLASLCALAALLCVLVPAFASAAITHNPEPFSPLDGSGSGLSFEEIPGIAIDEATGNVFVTDAGFEHERVGILGGEGGAPAGLATPYEISEIPFRPGAAEGGIAYDNSPTSPAHGTLYVYNPGIERVVRYVRNATSERYESTGDFAIPGAEFGRVTLSIDGSGDLYVSEDSNGASDARILKLNPSGALLDEYSFVREIHGEGNPLAGPGQIALDSAGDLFVAEGNAGVYKFPANASGEIDPTVFSQLVSGLASGVTVDPAANDVFASVEGAIKEYDTSGKKIAEFGVVPFAQNGQIVFDSASGRIYVSEERFPADVKVYGPALTVPTIGLGEASNVTGTKATLNGSVNAEGIAVEECFFEWGETSEYGHTAPCEELPPTDSEAHAVSAELSGLEANGVTYHFRLVATNKNGKEASADRSFETAETVATEAATGAGAAAATLNGTVRPEGLQDTACSFEYGLTTSAGFDKTVECEPAAAELPADFSPHPVKAAVAGLQPNTTYKFRLTATNGTGTLSGRTLTFTTQGPPQFSEIRARDADQTSATLEAKINPSGFGTSYRFEWGPTTAYGHSVPAEFEPFVGAGEEPVLVTAKLTGLASGTPYHYRLVATSKAGIGTSRDEVVETLDSCGLPDRRCFEMVSPRDRGPVVRPGEAPGNIELHFQAAPAPGSLAYVAESGQPDARKGDEVLYRGTRGPDGWSSSELSPPIVGNNESLAGNAYTGSTRGLSEDLACGIVESNQALTSDASTRLVQEAGGSSLYRHNPDGSYTAVSNLTPEDLGPGRSGDLEGLTGEHEYEVVGFSQDCGKVVFSTVQRYSGIESAGGPGTRRLYEWENGTLRSVGFVPGPSGEVAVEATPGTVENHANVVSADGSRVFFSAEGQIFVREHGASRDLSASETSTPDTGATYQYATKDGSRVFFTANAGLTGESSAEGKDLYEYDLEAKRLADLSVDHETGGAEVGGFVGTSEDGSHVYFIARGHLVPGKGKTLAENESDGTFSLYGEQHGEVKFVATVGSASDELQHVTVKRQTFSTSQVSPDGRYLLFQSRFNATGHEMDREIVEAYLYDADAPSDATICISCRQDGEPSVSPNMEHTVWPLGTGDEANPLHPLRTLVDSEGRVQAYFTSYDSLAPGAIAGKANIYEWAHGQVFLIAAEPPGLGSPLQAEKGEQEIALVEASADGTDFYLVTPQALNWENAEERWAVYDARVGGGFSEPPPPPAPCDANSEGSCQGASSAASAPPGAASSTFAGPGNRASAPVVAPAAAKPKAKLTRAQQLAKALTACRKLKAKAKRVSCEKRARARYGTKPKAKAKSGKKAKPHKGGK